jgi:hypothetical protein
VQALQFGIGGVFQGKILGLRGLGVLFLGLELMGVSVIGM